MDPWLLYGILDRCIDVESGYYLTGKKRRTQTGRRIRGCGGHPLHSRNARNVKHQLGGSNTQQRGTNEKWDGRRRNDDDFFFLPFRNPPPGIRASGKKENVWWADNRSNRITERARQTRREMNCTSFHLETQKIKETKRKKKKAIANDVITTLRSS